MSGRKRRKQQQRAVLAGFVAVFTIFTLITGPSFFVASRAHVVFSAGLLGVTYLTGRHVYRRGHGRYVQLRDGGRNLSAAVNRARHWQHSGRVTRRRGPATPVRGTDGQFRGSRRRWG